MAMDLSSRKKFDKHNKANRPFEYDTGNKNKYKKVAMDGHRTLPNGSIVVSVEKVHKTSDRR